MKIKHIYELFSISSDADFIRQAYLNLLNREADSNDLNFYLGIIALGYSKQHIIAEIISSNEFSTNGNLEIKGLGRIKKDNLFKNFLKFIGAEKNKNRANKIFHEISFSYDDKKQEKITINKENYADNNAQIEEGKIESLFNLSLFINDEVTRAKNYVKNIKNRPLIAVIPSYNDHKFLRKLVNSIYKHTENAIDKIIIADDASNDHEHIQYLEELRNKNLPIEIEVINSTTNTGFSANVNRGINSAPNNSDILLLNSDIEFFNNSLWAMLSIGMQNCGLAGARLLYPDERIQHAGGFRNFNALDWFDHKFRMKNSEYRPSIFYTKTIYCTGAALYIPREIINGIGLFDENYLMGYEDVDYCLRAWKNNFPVIYCGTTSMYHHESASRGKEQGPRELRSKEYFWESYTNFFHRKVDVDGKINIIFVTKDTGVGGGHRVIFNIINGLSRLHEKYIVQLWTLDKKPDWFDLDLRVIFRSYNDFSSLQADLSNEDAIKFATWWETAPIVWSSSIIKGIPAWLCQDIETSYYEKRDPRTAMIADASYAPEFIYVTVNKWLEIELGNRFHYHANYIGLGIDTDLFYPDKSKRNKKSVLVSARGEPLKGFDLTLDIIRRLIDIGYNIDMFGVDPELFPRIAHINYIYKPSNEKLRELYNKNEYFLQTSIHEGFSLPPVEAMSCECIPIVTDSFGNREYTRDQENCFVIPRDPGKAVEIIDGDTYESRMLFLSKNMKNTVNQYNWDKVIERIDKLLVLISENPEYGKTNFNL